MYSSDKSKPFTTSNAILAYCLYLAGIPFENNARPCRVMYSEEIVKRFVNGSGESIYKGWELDKAVEDAWKKKRRGHIEYVFQHPAELDNLLSAYKDQEKQLINDTGFAKDLIANIDDEEKRGIVQPNVALVKRTCVILKMRMSFMSMWEQVEPFVMIAKPGEVRRRKVVIDTKYGQREASEIEHPGYIIHSLYAGRETKEKLGL